MNPKFIVPVAGVVLAICSGVAIYFLMGSDSPRPLPPPADNSSSKNAPADESKPLQLEDFDLARIKPDPVRTDRPAQPYTASRTTVRITIEGRVVDESGAGIADARVQFIGAGKLNTVKGTGYTDGAGTYTLLAWTAGTPGRGEPQGRVAAEAPDGRVAVSNVTTLAEGDTASMPDLTVAAAATLEGQVVSNSGEPAAGAIITARSGGPVQVATMQGREPSASRRQYVTSVNAGADGRFTFKNLPLGTYQLSVEGGYYGVSEEKPAVDLTASAYAWQEVRLIGNNQVRGVLRDQRGEPVAGAVVRLAFVKANSPDAPAQPADPGVITPAITNLRDDAVGFRNDKVRANAYSDRRVQTDAAGRFGFSQLGDAEYRLEAKLGAGEATLPDVKINQPDYALQIDIKSSVSGTVRDAETGLPIEFYDARIASSTGEQTSPFDRVADDARFEYHPGGAYMLANPALKGAVVRICAAGYMPATLSFSDLAEGESKDGLDITLKPLCDLTFELTREGRRLDLEPVALLFDDRLVFEASSDKLGRVRIPRVAPATYRLKVTLADGTQLEADLTVPAARKATLEAKLSPVK